METRGNVGTYVAGSTSLDLRPATPSRRAPKASCADCHLPLARPGAWHICLDLSAPETVVVKAAPKPKKKATRRKSATIPKASRFVPRAELSPEELERRRERDRRYKREQRNRTACINACGRNASKPGVQCSTCSSAARRAFTPDQEAEVVRWYAEGLTTTQIADLCGVGSNTVRTTLERNGIARRKPTGRRPGVAA